MTSPVSVLHLTAHLGGGIGKALSGLILNTPTDSGINHTIACFEAPVKTHFLIQLADGGCPVVVAPNIQTLTGMIESADIVQLEWWGHPKTIEVLCRGALPAMRLLVWSHVSGIHTPIMPRSLIEASSRCIFTSPCSFNACEVLQTQNQVLKRLDVIHSAGGFEGFDFPERGGVGNRFTAGYLGSLNFAKLHPHFIEYLSAVKVPDFSVRMIGDVANREILEKQCVQAGRPSLLDFRGYSETVATELTELDVMPYLLNPQHYGTTENALLEAMSMGVVPIVLDNPAERCLVTDRETGFVVRTPNEFANAMRWLLDNPTECCRIRKQAALSVRERFGVDVMTGRFCRHYHEIMSEGKSLIPFESFFGGTPAEWFLACQRYPEIFIDGTFKSIDDFTLPGLLEKTKGSVFHFHKQFPEDEKLTQWVERISNLNTPVGSKESYPCLH